MVNFVIYILPQKSYKHIIRNPSRCDSVGWASSYKPEGCRFDSQLGHMPGLQAHVLKATDWCSSPTVMFPSLFPSLSLYKNKNILSKKTPPHYKVISCYGLKKQSRLPGDWEYRDAIHIIQGSLPWEGDIFANTWMRGGSWSCRRLRQECARQGEELVQHPQAGPSRCLYACGAGVKWAWEMQFGHEFREEMGHQVM